MVCVYTHTRAYVKETIVFFSILLIVGHWLESDDEDDDDYDDNDMTEYDDAKYSRGHARLRLCAHSHNNNIQLNCYYKVNELQKFC